MGADWIGFLAMGGFAVITTAISTWLVGRWKPRWGEASIALVGWVLPLALAWAAIIGLIAYVIATTGPPPRDHVDDAPGMIIALLMFAAIVHTVIDAVLGLPTAFVIAGRVRARAREDGKA